MLPKFSCVFLTLASIEFILPVSSERVFSTLFYRDLISSLNSTFAWLLNEFLYAIEPGLKGAWLLFYEFIKFLLVSMFYWVLFLRENDD